MRAEDAPGMGGLQMGEPTVGFASGGPAGSIPPLAAIWGWGLGKGKGSVQAMGSWSKGGHGGAEMQEV